FFIKNYRRLQSEQAAKKSQLEVMHGLYADRDLWDKRDGWLQQKFPKLQNQSAASAEVLDRIKNQAKKHTVLIENQGLGVPQKKTDYVAVSVRLIPKVRGAISVRSWSNFRIPANSLSSI